MDGGLRTSDLVPEDGPLTELAALRAQGELPKEIVQRNARLAYEVTPKEGPNCGDDVATGDPCVCSYGFGDTDICSLPLDGGSVLRLSCVLRANDVKKRIEVTRSCAPLLSSCEKLTCCPGYECVTTDAGYARCEESR